MIIYDPVYFAEPYIRTSLIWALDPTLVLPPYPCEEATDTVVEHGTVPHYLPGKSLLPGAGSEGERSVRHAVRGAPRRTRDDVSRVHQEDAAVPPAECEEARRLRSADNERRQVSGCQVSALSAVALAVAALMHQRAARASRRPLGPRGRGSRRFPAPMTGRCTSCRFAAASSMLRRRRRQHHRARRAATACCWSTRARRR